MPDPSRFHLTLTSAGRPVMHGWWLLEATARGKFVSWIGGYGGLPDARVALVDQETGTLLDVWPGVVGARWLRELDAPPGTAPGAGRSAARSTVAVNTWEQQLRRDYKPRYVKSIMSVMRVMFDDAVQSKVCGDNPVPTLKSRRLGKYKGKQQHDATILPPPRPPGPAAGAQRPRDARHRGLRARPHHRRLRAAYLRGGRPAPRAPVPRRPGAGLPAAGEGAASVRGRQAGAGRSEVWVDGKHRPAAVPRRAAVRGARLAQVAVVVPVGQRQEDVDERLLLLGHLAPLGRRSHGPRRTSSAGLPGCRT